MEQEERDRGQEQSRRSPRRELESKATFRRGKCWGTRRSSSRALCVSIAITIGPLLLF